MKPYYNLIIATGLAAVLSSCASRPPSEAEGGPRYYYAKPTSSPSTPSIPSNPSPSTRPTPAPATYQSSETPWPRIVKNDSSTITIYEPQVDSWDGHALVARNA